MNNQSRSMPTVAAVVKHWATEEADWLKSHYIGWGEPFCFACGWLPPVQKWESAGRWLDRAHLHDRFYGGPDAPHNLAMLCHLCHDAMPDSESLQFGLDWVKQRPHCGWPWQVFTDDILRRVTKPTRSTTLLRARLRFTEAMSTLPAGVAR